MRWFPVRLTVVLVLVMINLYLLDVAGSFSINVCILLKVVLPSGDTGHEEKLELKTKLCITFLFGQCVFKTNRLFILLID